MQDTVSIFYACDDSFVKFTVVSLSSMIKNADPTRKYHVTVLHTGISDRMKKVVLALSNETFSIDFRDVTDYLDSISDRLPIRDYYSKTTYYRLFIAEMYPHLSKAIYIDSDTVVTGDISRLYDTPLGDAYLGACHEQAMLQADVYGTYVEQVMGIPRDQYFNAGLMLLNCEALRRTSLLDRFIALLQEYNFVVTQDEDYLNVLCHDHVYWLDDRWNTEVFGTLPHPAEEAHVLHYIMANKPWHYSDCRHGDIFWQYAKETPVYSEILSLLEGYTDEQRAQDAASCERLAETARRETEREDRYLMRVRRHRDPGRLAILDKIAQYEREGRFDEDVEDDPPSRMLMPDEVDYLRRSPIAKIKTRWAFAAAHRFVKGLVKDKKMILRDIRGLEHWAALKSGAVVTCNHFNAYDSFAMQLAYEAAGQPARAFYRVIREGNYTSFPGFYGMLMRHCNTLPLSSNHKTLRKFTEATTTLLREGHFVLIYPEQSMWWNYRKPKPLKSGAFTFAARASVPVLPCFITLRDSHLVGEDGFPIQEYTIHIAPPVYPDESLPYGKRVEALKERNAAVWRDIYREEYGADPVYSTES